ncbi:hypothetical protein ACHWQZ_G009895 [Mnemiopsis leidyi]
MPVDKIQLQHKFGIISHNHRQNLLERISAPPTPTSNIRKPIPCEISHDFILSYNRADPFERAKLDVKASQLLQRVKRRAGLLSGGSGRHVHIPRSWVELTLLARCKGAFRDDVLKVLFASLLTAPPSVDNIPSLFLVCETVIEWIKELGNPIPETAWSNTQILTYNISELCFWRVYNHALLHNLQGCDSFLSDLNWHVENLEFVRKVYAKYPDGELLLRLLESIKTVISGIYPSKEESNIPPKKNFASDGLMYALDFYQCVRNGSDPSTSLSALLTTLTLLGTEDHLNTVLTFKLLTVLCCKNFLALQIIQAAATGNLPISDNNTEHSGICKSNFQSWDWVTASEFINLLVHAAIEGETSEIQKSAIQAGEMTSVRVDSAPVLGYGLLDIAALNTEGTLGPAVQYALQQALTRLHIHIKNHPLRKSAAHIIWSALQTTKNSPSHRVIVGIAQNKTNCFESVQSELEPHGKLLFERIFDNLADHYIPQSIPLPQSKPSKTKAPPKKSPRASYVQPTVSMVSNISVISKPGSVVKLMNKVRTLSNPHLESYADRNNKILQDVVADQWYKELLSVFRAAEKVQQTVQECEEFSEAEQNHAQKMVKELDLTETEVCNVMDSLVVKT